MVGVRRPLEEGSIRLVPDGRRRRLEEVTKPPGRARLHALQRLGLTRGVLGQCLFGETREKVLGLREGCRPTLFGCELFQDECSQGVLLRCRELCDFAEGLIEELRHGPSILAAL